MAFLEVKHVRIAGLSACVPKNIEENCSIAVLSKEDADNLITSIGIERKRKAAPGVCTSDLCYEAANQLIKDLAWNKDDIDCLIFVSQGPDYYLPATSCILQDRLGLNEKCFTLDISLGCSGWVYGLSVISSLLSHGTIQKGLLLAGDISCMNSPKDKSTYPLFGDAGSVTALEYDPDAKGFQFHFGTDGSGYEAIIIPDGNLSGRNPMSPESFVMHEIEPGIERCRLNTVLEGMDIFSFGITKVPETVNKLIERYSINIEAIDYFVFHQANLFLNEKIRKKLKLPAEKVPYSLKDFGNTSSATIPLTIVTELKNEVRTQSLSCLGCGFGVGLSWGAVVFQLDRIVVSELVEI